MKSINSECLNRFSKYYTEKISRRIILGFIIGGSFWTLVFIITILIRTSIDGIEWSLLLMDLTALFDDLPVIGSLIISLFELPLANDAEWFKIMLNDLPSLALIIGLILTFEIWGLIPRPITRSEKEDQLEEKNG